MLAIASGNTIREAGALDSDVYFYLAEKTPRCFVEEMPAQTILIGDYRSTESETKKAVITITGPSGGKVYSEPCDPVGRFAYHTVTAGDHTVCISADPSAPAWPEHSNSLKFHMKLEIHGHDSEIPSDAAKKEHLSSLEKELEELDNQVDLIVKDLEYSKTQEQHFREQTERINSRIMWWSLFQTLLLLLSGVWQIVHLKNFFRAKKLV